MLILNPKYLKYRRFDRLKRIIQIGMYTVCQPQKKVGLAISMSHYTTIFTCCEKFGNSHIQALDAPAGKILAEFQIIHSSEVRYWYRQHGVDFSDHPFVVLIIIAFEEICKRSGALSLVHAFACLFLSPYRNHNGAVSCQKRQYKVKPLRKLFNYYLAVSHKTITFAPSNLIINIKFTLLWTN